MIHAPALLALIERKLQNTFSPSGSEHASRFQEEIISAHLHPLLAGGKRIRPLTVLMVAGIFGGRRSFEFALPAACALELVHTYSLVHDDLPCMDNDDLRRGKPTTHKLYGDAKGLLVGDGLLTKSFEVLADFDKQLFDEQEHIEVKQRRALFSSMGVGTLARAAGMSGMVFGQWMDMSQPNEVERTSWEFVESVATRKTGALLAAAFELGVLAGSASLSGGMERMVSPEMRDLLNLAHGCGIHFGVAFQVIDDLLDVTASTEAMGKTVGKDAAQDKVTAVTVLGIEAARTRAEEHTLQAKRALLQLQAHSWAPRDEEGLAFGSALNQLVDSLLERKS